MSYPPIGIQHYTATLPNFGLHFISGLHTFPFGLHALNYTLPRCRRCSAADAAG